MDNTRLKVYLVLLPLNRNDGIPMESERIAEAIQEAKTYAGGVTLLSPGYGLSFDNEKSIEYRDLILPLLMVMSGDQQAKGWVERYAQRQATLLDQEKVFVLALEGTSEFRSPEACVEDWVYPWSEEHGLGASPVSLN